MHWTDSPPTAAPAGGPLGTGNGPKGLPGPLPDDLADPALTVPLGPVTLRHLSRLVEQGHSGVLLAVIEAAGADPQRNWRLVIGGATLLAEG